jgi:hypothetical protein
MPAANLLSETKACDLLARVFRDRGYDIVRNVPFREYGVSFHIDGWDAKARVGFEFLTSEDDDHDDLTLEEYQTLMAAQLRGELALFIMDEVEPFTPDDLRGAAEEFLDQVAEAALAVRSRGKKTAGRKAGARKKVATKATGKKKAAKKKSRSPKKAAKKKAAGRKKKAARRGR